MANVGLGKTIRTSALAKTVITIAHASSVAICVMMAATAIQRRNGIHHMNADVAVARNSLLVTRPAPDFPDAAKPVTKFAAKSVITGG